MLKSRISTQRPISSLNRWPSSLSKRAASISSIAAMYRLSEKIVKQRASVSSGSVYLVSSGSAPKGSATSQSSWSCRKAATSRSLREGKWCVSAPRETFAFWAIMAVEISPWPTSASASRVAWQTLDRVVDERSAWVFLRDCAGFWALIDFTEPLICWDLCSLCYRSLRYTQPTASKLDFKTERQS